ncbi:MAG: S-adenosylmethionine tRNA ribosyltransferase [Bacteroidetes bacterium]|nr:MAG: S-adenosylmethionine tRNA ribosyltransferase [Bacteroidota bacterium]PTM08588.1 MAG: S-adenosylmethionine tRNA ribosyltransferase [Bacteroidota bacterium]
MPQHLNIAAFDYDLPDERIARYPLPQRDASKLLVYREGHISEQVFNQLPHELPPGSLLVFNNTRVIHARLLFELPDGRPLEILCLEPLTPADYQQNLSSLQEVEWKCLVGGNRRWKTGTISQTIHTGAGDVQLTAVRTARLDGPFVIRFQWDQPRLSFGELLAAGGIIPLPPYLNRASEAADNDRYQTIYAQPEGSVAAPTAGLHFTDAVFNNLDTRGIHHGFVTLHVGAGTFKPVTTDSLGEHEMHRESIFVQRPLLDQLAATLVAGQPVVPVGTTSMRTLESLYWLGVRVLRDPAQDLQEFTITQWEPYETPAALLPSPAAAIQVLCQQLDRQALDTVSGYTQLLIAPGYPSQLVSGLITNFHQPRSTLLLLVAALIGDDWQRVYDFALSHEFRFLSYGDSSLLWRV